MAYVSLATLQRSWFTDLEHELQQTAPDAYIVPQIGLNLSHGGALAVREAPLPAMEYRVTYVPTRFTYTQVCVRAFFTFTSGCMLIAYAIAIASQPTKREHGQVARLG